MLESALTKLSAPSGFSLPPALTQRSQLDPKDWVLRGLQILPHVTGYPTMEATLLPWNKKAIDKLKFLTGQCFFAMDCLWHIEGCQVNYLVDENALVAEITCKAIWREGKDESRRCCEPEELAQADAPIRRDIAYCPGWGDGPEDWLDECPDCQRRLSLDKWEQLTPEARYALRNRDGTLPPTIVTLWCESYIPPDRPEDQQLRNLLDQENNG